MKDIKDSVEIKDISKIQDNRLIMSTNFQVL
jgi:hypothetical protein